MNHLIDIDGVRKQYGGIEALQLDKLTIERGRIVAVVGANGAGKTTLLKLLALLDHPSAGSVQVNGIDVSVPSPARSGLRKQITMVLQNPYMFRSSVTENVAFGLRTRGVRGDVQRHCVSEALQTMGLHDLEKRPARSLSAGEIQRVAIARALVIKPMLLLLDEPMASVDQAHVSYVERAIREIRDKENTAVVLATHNIDLGIGLGEDIISLVNGRVSDIPLRNHFSGIVIDRRGEKVVEVSPGVKVCVVTEKTGKVYFAVNPSDVIISLTPLESSARNVLEGIIVSLNRAESQVRVTIDTGVKLDAVVTLKSLEEMKLCLGMRVFAVFKTSCVKVF